MPFDFDKIAEDAEGQGIFPEDSGIGKAMLFEAAKHEPDQFASDVTLAEKTGLSPTVVETDRQRATRASLFKDLDIDYIKKTNPALYNKIRSPEDAPIIQDDISALAELGNYILGVGDGFTRGNELITLSKKGQNLYDDPENTQIRRELKDGFESLSPSREIKDLGSFALAIPEMTAEQIPIQGELYLPNSFGEYLAGVAYPMMLLGPQVIDRAFHLERNLHFSESMIQEDAQGRGIDTTEAKIAANSYASVATVFEAVPQLKFGKILGGKAIAKSIAKSATAKAMARPTVRRLIKDKGKDILWGFVSEGITEFLQSVAESLFRNEAIRSSDTSLKAADAETIIADAIQEGLAGAAGGGGFSIISAVPSSAIEFRDIQKAKQYEGRLQALKGKVTETKTFKRRKEVLESYINEHTEGEEIALDARAVAQYFQDIDPNGKEGSAIIKELGIEEAFVDALSRGDDVHAPLGTFMKLAGNKHFDSLVQETRDSATGMTPRESVIAEANLENKMVAEAEQLLAENDALSEVVQSANEVESNIRSQLESSGRFTPDVVDRYTALHKAFAVTTAARTGQLPADIYNNMGLTISDEVTQGGVQFEQAAPTKVDALTDAPADSVVETSAEEVLKYETDVPRLSPERMVELTKSVQERGIVGELPVIREGGKLTLEDGHHLARVAQSLGLPVPVRIYEGDTLENRSKILEATVAREEAVRESEEFKKWFGNSKIVDKKGDPLVVYHGTTHDIEQFEFERGNVENDFGVGFYFSSAPADASINYAGEGPDLEQRIQMHAESLDIYDIDPEEAVEQARVDLHGGQPNVLPVYLSFQKPAVLGGRNETQLGGDSASALEVSEAIEAAAAEFDDINVTQLLYEDSFGFKGYSDNLDSFLLDEGLSAFELSEALRLGEGSAYATDKATGSFAGGDFIRRVFEELGFDGIIDNKVSVKFGPDREAGKPMEGIESDTTHYVAFEPTQIKSQFNVGAFDPSDPRILAQEKRGDIRIFDDKATVRLFEAADLSTFLHESGHFFLEQMTLLAPRAPEIQKDLDLIMKWMGVSHPSDIQTEQHEKFARGFEAYLREGKAPSAELETAFSRFRAWLVHIYRSAAKLRVELNDDIRGVFDRMLASDNAINEQKNRPDEKLLYESAEEAGMTPEEFKAYTEAKQTARDAAKRDLTHETMRELNRQRTEAWKEEVKELTAETQDELGQLPAYKAKSFLATGKFPDGTEPGIEPMKLSRAGVIETSGKELLGKLPFGKNTVWVKEGGVHPDAAAPLLGFSSGDEMVKAMVAAPNFNKAVKESVENEMKRRHGDLLNEPERLREEAEAALANDEKATAIKIELQSLEKQSRRSLTPKQALRNAARRIIAETPVGEVTPGKYLATSLRQARATLEHVANGEYGQASTAKRNQLLNHFLYMEARDAIKEIESTQRYMTKFGRPGVRKNIEQVHLDQIDSALEAYDFKRSVTQKELQKRKSLARYIEEQEALGNQVIVSKDLVDATNTKHYKNMSLEELRGLKDAIKNMEHLGRLKSKLLDNQRHRDFEEWKGEAIGSMLENNKVHPVAPEFGKGFVTKAKKGAKYVHAELLNMEFVLKKLDGDKLGVMHNSVFRPLSDAQDEAIERRNSAAEYFKPLFKKLKREWGWSPKVHVPEVGQSFHREELVSIALNWGNEGNRQRIRDGYNWSDAKVGAILDNLTKEEWGFIQGTWDYLDNVLWPEVQALEKELTGVAPEKVPASKIKTKHGTMRGGYYPLRYDSDFSERQVRFDEKATVQDIFGGNWAKAQTKKGHVEARVEELKRPVKLDLGVLSEHLTSVIQDLTHRKPIMDVYRFLKDEEVASAIKSTAGLETYRQMIPWLRDIAGGFRMPAAGSLGRILMHARTGTSIVGIGLSVTTALINLTGIFPALVEVSADRLIKGVTRTAFNPVETWEFISERSSMMNHRSQVFDREASEQIRKQFQKKGSIVPLATWYMLIAKVDQVVTMSTWMGAYEKGMADSENHEKAAIEYADHVVRTTQSSGRPIDLSSFQRGSEFQKLFTVFYSYFNMVYNQLGRNVSNLKNQGAGYFPRFMGNLVAVVLLPALLGELLAGRGPDEEDDESWAQWSSRNLVSYTTGTVPLLRDMSGPMYRSLIDRDAPYYPYKLTPVAGAIQSIINMGSQFGAEDPDTKKRTKAVIDAAGYWLHLPARQTWKTTEHVWDSVTGERDFNPWHMLAGQPREE